MPWAGDYTGPVTEMDSVWPEDWVRLKPKCTYESYETAVTCTLVENLPENFMIRYSLFDIHCSKYFFIYLLQM